MSESVMEPLTIERVKIVVPQPTSDDLRRAFSTLIGPTREEPGCLKCELFTGWPEHNAILLESYWKTRSDLVRHIRSQTYKGLLQMMERGSEAPSIEFITVSELKGLELIEEARGQQA